MNLLISEIEPVVSIPMDKSGLSNLELRISKGVEDDIGTILLQLDTNEMEDTMWKINCFTANNFKPGENVQDICKFR